MNGGKPWGAIYRRPALWGEACASPQDAAETEFGA